MRLLPKDRDLNRPLDQVELKVDASALRLPIKEVHVRLDHFLTERLTWRSRTSVQSLIRDGYVQVDASTPDHPEGTGSTLTERRPGRRLAHGSRIVVVVPEALRLPDVSPPSDDLTILYEDADCLAVDKPAGLTVHPSGRWLANTLIQRVYAHYGCEDGDREQRPRLCHRLDRETSGVVLIGKHPEAHARLMRAFEERRVDKEYLAIVRGAPEIDAGTIDLPVGPSRSSEIELKMAVRADGQEARTDWTVVSRDPGCTLLACRPHTGRQHQIRVHLDAIGLPLVGDKLYGREDEVFQRAADHALTPEDERALELPRQALHNHRLGFAQPFGGERVEVVCPLAEDLAAYLDRARGA